MRVRMIITAAVLGMLVAGCSGDDDSAGASSNAPSSEPTASPSASPTPSASPSQARDPFPGIDLTLTGEGSGGPVVETVEVFVKGSSYTFSELEQPAEFRAVLGRPVQRIVSSGIADAKREDWTVSTKPIVHVDAVRVDGGEAQVRLCRWSPSTDWRRRSDFKNVQNLGGWHALDLSMEQTAGQWRIVDVVGDGTCARSAP